MYLSLAGKTVILSFIIFINDFMMLGAKGQDGIMH